MNPLFRALRFLVPMLAGISVALSSAHAADAAAPPAKTVVLVHGAFADGSGWAEVIQLLQARGVKVVSVQNPMLSLAGDAEVTRRAIDMQESPVVLVGHSWGGMVITEAGTHPKVASLVYVAAFAPDVGMSVTSLTQGRPPMDWLQELMDDGAGFVRLSDLGIERYFASGLPAREARLIAAVQGMPFGGTFTDAATQAGWKTRPSWYLRATQDLMIDPELQAEMAAHIGARTVNLRSGHLPMLSHPRAVAALILVAMNRLPAP